MAILPANISGSGKTAAGARFRQRKISVKISLPIYNASDISATDQDLEPSQLHHLNASAQQARDLHTVETGVDKNEEDEVHLQQVINAAQRVLLGSTKESTVEKEPTTVYIPTPDASKTWPEASKFYSDEAFTEPESYIKFSATVEDTLGVEYNMDEVDEDFFHNTLSKYPKPKSDSVSKKTDHDQIEKESVDTRKCSMLEFEAICDKFEKTIEEKQPFLSVDPSNILSFKDLSAAILGDLCSKTTNEYSYAPTGVDQKYMSTFSLKEKLSKELNFSPFVTTFDKDQQSTNSTRSMPKLMELFGEVVYNHWKERKIARKGKSIAPTLKFEDPNANEKENDNDPYVCFRRREFRQARKTRRADNLGAERIRLLQKSLKRSREIVLATCKREILKLKSWESDYEIFKLRSEAKQVKRMLGIKGDDHLFYAHKRKKIVKPEPEEEDGEVIRTRKERKKQSESAQAFAQTKDQVGFNGQLQPEASSTQPYVKLPPSKIPDMDLVTVSFILKEKNEAIKRAVIEKIRKRKEHDKGYINLTYDPLQPFFDISTNNGNKELELEHIPYSSIASSYYHQFNTSNIISDYLKKCIEEGTSLYPGMKTFSGANGDLIPSEHFPQLHTLLNDHFHNKLNDSSNYIAQLLTNIETNNFSTYTNGFKRDTDSSQKEFKECSGPIFNLRKRAGRNGQIFVDRKGLISRPNDEIDEWLKFEEDSEELEDADTDSNKMDIVQSKDGIVKDAYHNKKDAITRLDSRWRFDEDYPEYDKGVRNPISLDPSKLNSISDETQSIRFGSMLLSKSYDLLRESAHQRQVLIQQARIRALQQHQLNKNRSQVTQQPGSGNKLAGSSVPGRTMNGTVGSGSLANSGSGYRSVNSQSGYSTGGTATTGNKYSSNYGRGQSNYTAQQLQALQQYKQNHQNQQPQATAGFAPKRNAGSPTPRTNSTATELKNSQRFSGNQKNAGEVGK